jgi:hypothetical protein
MKKVIVLTIALFILSAGLFAQSKAGKTDSTHSANLYSCPTHPNIVSTEPGTCSICGKNLLLSKKEQMKMGVMKIYTCPIHSDVSSDHPGNCSKCGMAMIEKKKTISINEKTKSKVH